MVVTWLKSQISLLHQWLSTLWRVLLLGVREKSQVSTIKGVGWRGLLRNGYLCHVQKLRWKWQRAHWKIGALLRYMMKLAHFFHEIHSIAPKSKVSNVSDWNQKFILQIHPSDISKFTPRGLPTISYLVFIMTYFISIYFLFSFIDSFWKALGYNLYVHKIRIKHSSLPRSDRGLVLFKIEIFAV